MRKKFVSVNGGAYKGCTSPMKDALKMKFNSSSGLIKQKDFRAKNYGISHWCLIPRVIHIEP